MYGAALRLYTGDRYRFLAGEFLALAGDFEAEVWITDVVVVVVIEHHRDAVIW